MKNSLTFFPVTVLLLLFGSLNYAGAQNFSSLKERGYEALTINAQYAFYNDLGEITDNGTFEHITAGYRKIDGAYEIFIDFGWTKEIIYIDVIDFVHAAPVANGLDYQRSVFSDGREEVFVSVHINHKMAFYSSEKNSVP